MPSIMTLQGPGLRSLHSGKPSLRTGTRPRIVLMGRQSGMAGVADDIAQHPFLALLGVASASYLAYRAVSHVRGGSIAGLAGAVSREAKSCISDEIAKHCHKKPGKCASAKERKQAVAIGYSICKRAGFRSIPARP